MTASLDHLKGILRLIGLTITCLKIWLLREGAHAAQAISEAHGPNTDTTTDPYLWLEDVTGEKALTWVRQQNGVSTNELESASEFEPIRSRLLSIMDSKERIPYVAKHGKWYYNFWRDQTNPRGLWRRTTLIEFKKPQP